MGLAQLAISRSPRGSHVPLAWGVTEEPKPSRDTWRTACLTTSGEKEATSLGGISEHNRVLVSIAWSEVEEVYREGISKPLGNKINSWFRK